MEPALPLFRYHPDPVASGVFEASDVACACCGQARGVIYVGPVYATGDLEGKLCPWCIADGSAAEKLGASFSDSYPLNRAGVPSAVVDEINHRTPGYVSWQQETWLAHCGDACEFRGDISRKELATVAIDVRCQLLEKARYSDEGWAAFVRVYEPGGAVAVYKFVCRHCGQIVLGMDAS